MNQDVFSLSACGDSFITRRLPPGDSEAARLAALMADSEVRFCNLEVVLRRRQGFPAAQSGGTWATAAPESLDDLRAYGFNLLAWANNHTLDYSYGGMQATAKYLNRGGWVHAGVGRDLPEAAAPRFLETPAGRVGFLAATASFHQSWAAGNPRPEIGGRPGVNPLRYQTTYHLAPEQLADLDMLAKTCGINKSHELQVKEGFARADEEGVIRFGEHLFKATGGEGQGAGEVTRPDRRDLKRIIRNIEFAKSQADLVLVSIHAHQMKEGRKDLPADFLVEFAHACIDAGAHAVIGHGPHVLRPVEIYRQCPIFYSLGNFIFQNETVPYLPADFYEKYDLDSDATTAEALDRRTDNGRLGLAANPSVWHSVVARWTMREGKLKTLRLHPVSLGFEQPRHRQGWPRLTSEIKALREMINLCRVFGTEFKLERSTLVWSKG